MNNAASIDIDNICIVFSVPLAIKRRSGRRQVITPPTGAGGKEIVLVHQEEIVIAIARALSVAMHDPALNPALSRLLSDGTYHPTLPLYPFLPCLQITLLPRLIAHSEMGGEDCTVR
ncbi:MAG: hypothetical protein ACYC1M_14335 [Armatimonadota bacterium]